MKSNTAHAVQQFNFLGVDKAVMALGRNKQFQTYKRQWIRNMFFAK